MNIELPVAQPGSSNKPPTSFYQQCFQLVQKIWSLSNHHPQNESIKNGYDFGKDLFPIGTENVEGIVFDPVTLLWDFCSLGAPLCALMNLFKDSEKIEIIEIDHTFPLEITMKPRQKAIFKFIKSCKDTLKMTDSELFTISDVFRDDTNYFIKVVKTLTKVMDKLKEKEDLPKEIIPLPESLGLTELNVDDSTDYRAKQIKELLETERSYVRDLELLRAYKNEAEYKRILSKDKSMKLFANIDDLVDFQRRFLVGLESTLALPVQEQRIGIWFSSMEENFNVYDAYCANQESASELAVKEAGYLADSWSKVYSHFNNLPENSPASINPNNQIPSYLIRPVQRLCKYPLLLERLLKHDRKEKHPYADELEQGLEAIKRVVTRTNETKRREENAKKVIDLKLSVESWKGLQTNQFGELLLTDQFDVSTIDSAEKILNFYLFEHILLSFKENGKPKRSKVDGKARVPLMLKNSIFTPMITKVEDISIPNQMKFQLKVEFKTSDALTSIVLKTKKGLDLVKKWVDEFNDMKKKRVQKQSAFNNNTQLISNLSNMYDQGYNTYQYQYQYESSEEEYTEEQLNLKNLNTNSYSSNMGYNSMGQPLPATSSSHHYHSSSYSRTNNNPMSSPDPNGSLSQSFSSNASSSYFNEPYGNEVRNPQYDFCSNYYDDSLLDDYLQYDSDNEDENNTSKMTNSISSSISQNQYYSSQPQTQPPPPQQQQQQPLPPPPPLQQTQNGYYSHSRSNSNQFSAPPRNSSYNDLVMSAQSAYPPSSINNDSPLFNNLPRMNSNMTHHRNLSNPIQQPPQPSQRVVRERSLSRGSHNNPNIANSSSSSLNSLTNNLNNLNLGSINSSLNSINSQYAQMNPITPPITPTQNITNHANPLLAQAPPIAQLSQGKGQHRSFLPGLTLGATTKLKTHFREDTFTLAVPSTCLSYSELRSKIEKKLRLCGRIQPDQNFNQLSIRYKDEVGHHVPIQNDDDVFEAFETTYRNFVGKHSSGTMVIEIFVH